MTGKEALDNIAVYSATHNHLLDTSVEVLDKELKALEIIKNKKVDVLIYAGYVVKKLSEEEFNLLKEVLGE